MRHLLAAALAAFFLPAMAGVIGGPNDHMGPAVTEHGPLVNHALDPATHPGWDVARTKATTQTPAQSDIGGFRIICFLAGINHDDPLVFPGKPGATHTHTYFGAKGVNAFTTPEMLSAMPSTCQGGKVNHSAYWTPALIDTATGAVVPPLYNMVYYKTGYNGIRPDQVRTIPNGLRMIAGNAKNSEKRGPIVHKCVGKDPLTGVENQQAGVDIPDCAVGTTLLAEVAFPQCVAVDAYGEPVLDSPDHKAHVAYTVPRPDLGAFAKYGRWCPLTHPYPIPEVRFVINYPKVTEAGQTKRWRYSSDMYDPALPSGRSFHGDYIKMWDDTAWDSLMRLLQASRDGHAYLLGNGLMIY